MIETKAGLAEMLKGGVIMDVDAAEQASIAEAAGAVAVMALERVPADIRSAAGERGSHSRPHQIAEIQAGQHPGDGEGPHRALRGGPGAGGAGGRLHGRIRGTHPGGRGPPSTSGPSRSRSSRSTDLGEDCGGSPRGCDDSLEGRGRHRQRGRGRSPHPSHPGEVRRLGALDPAEVPTAAKELPGPVDLVRPVAETGGLPVVLFCAGGIATAADAALMQLGAEGNFVGSGIFKSSDPARRAQAVVEATTHHDDPERVAAASRELGEAMPGIEIGSATAACCRTAAGEPLCARGRGRPVSALDRRSRHSGRLRHARRWRRWAPSRAWCAAAELEGLDGLVIPGGESPR